MESKVYNQKGKEVGTVSVPETVFGLPWNPDLVHQVVVSMESNARRGTAHTKDRGEVAGGGKKPWKQKGTGRARHGSIRSPIWVGGGVTHGPRNDKNYSRKINRAMRTKALCVVLSKKFKNNQVLFVDKFEFSAPKTREALGVLKALATHKGFDEIVVKKKNAAFIALPKNDQNTVLSFRNFQNLVVDDIRNLNPVSALNAKYLVIANPEEAFTALTAKVS